VALVVVRAVVQAVPSPGGRVVALPTLESDRVDDAGLVARAQRGDGWAQEAIYRRHVRLVASIAMSMLRDPIEVDDVVQETFLIAFEQLRQLGEPAALRGWLARITVSRVHRRFRFRRWTRLWSATELEARLEEQATADATQAQRAELALVDRALASMSFELRTAWVLRHVLGHEVREIAAACDWSPSTCKRRLGAADAIVERHVRGQR
jgi:RNA polymerase sigma-70 factor (ECF subfamily)